MTYFEYVSPDLPHAIVLFHEFVYIIHNSSISSLSLLYPEK